MSAALSSPALRIVVGEPVDGVVPVGVVGEVDTASADELRVALTAVLAGTGVRGLVVDLTAVPFLAVPGLHPLLEAQATAAGSGRSMSVLAGPHGGVDRLLHRAGLRA
ncbi:STAS domain-containing protein [Klenkia brasiliensis]|uniref:Anti-anti-sigma factor n=1 Tax=Klenkia brasiliensis TaxID=333142 RepID=A0A1G7ZVE1_9ACTN|nr:STAS domain-containing protein [Klenkia brasiliensis]SDH12612.1 anti-anti-sigma factor [Klenkia brasiliensis]